jgi:hypothetical protein
MWPPLCSILNILIPEVGTAVVQRPPKCLNSMVANGCSLTWIVAYGLVRLWAEICSKPAF